MDEAIFEKLEFDMVRQALAGHCATALGQRLARSIRPTTKAKVARGWLEQVRELGSVLDDDSRLPMGGLHDVREAVKASALATPLEADALAAIAETLSATGKLCTWLERVADATPSLDSLRDQIRDLSPLGRSIYEKIDARGCVLDDASPKLASIRGAIEQARKQTRIVFDRLLRQPSYTRMLQYAGATFHNDRMVLPLKAEHRGRIPGIIHRSSDSGATLFVEPAESVELNNSIVRLRDDETKELTRILQELSREVQDQAKVIMVTLRAVGVIDVVAAKVRYAKHRGCICPIINDDGVLDLHEARHPVLLELFSQDSAEDQPARKVVPIDIRLGDDFDVLVITGPNTGGKTVALKTVGLIALMTQCGIPIPAAEGSRMPVYSNIAMDIGDEQSLQQSLSTFSSHLRTQLKIMAHCGPRTLVLIDELGAGTDPDEGAAIGRAILSELMKLQAKAVVTTHLSALKTVAFTNKRVDNASVEFDPETLRPTFHVRLGEPGNSNALIIAKRLGMSARLVNLAKSYLDDRMRSLNTAIAGTLESRRQAETARKEALAATLEAQRKHEEYQIDRQRLQEKEKAFEAWTTWVNALRTGDAVFVKSLNRPATVVRMELHRQQALVSRGGMDIEVRLRDLTIPQPEE